MSEKYKKLDYRDSVRHLLGRTATGRSYQGYASSQSSEYSHHPEDTETVDQLRERIEAETKADTARIQAEIQGLQAEIDADLLYIRKLTESMRYPGGSRAGQGSNRQPSDADVQEPLGKHDPDPVTFEAQAAEPEQPKISPAEAIRLVLLSHSDRSIAQTLATFDQTLVRSVIATVQAARAANPDLTDHDIHLRYRRRLETEKPDPDMLQKVQISSHLLQGTGKSARYIF